MMNKVIGTIAVLGYASAQADLDTEVGELRACHLYVPNEFTMWDLTTLDKTRDGLIHGDYHAGDYIEFDFCRYLESTSYFASTFIPGEGNTILTGDTYLPSSTEPLRDENDKYSGVSVTHDSSTICEIAADGTETMYSFNTKIMCDKDLTEQGGATIESFDDSTCDVTVTLKHNAGCHIYTANWW